MVSVIGQEQKNDSITFAFYSPFHARLYADRCVRWSGIKLDGPWNPFRFSFFFSPSFPQLYIVSRDGQAEGLG